MDLNVIWNKFLEKLKDQLLDIAYSYWFKNTQLVNLKNDTATVVVQDESHKRHILSNYISIMEDIFNEVTGSNFKFDLITNEEFQSINIKNVTNLSSRSNELDSNLIAKYTFESFVVGENNRFNKSIALAVAQQPGELYNPLFIYGNSGLGKTHLMHAIGNYITKNSEKKVLYITSENFVNDFIQINRYKKNNDNFNAVDSFKEKYRNVDVLIIDDIQYMEIADKTQDEFFHTFDELYRTNKQIIIASDKSPDDLRKIEERLRTRFSWGISLEINPPDFNARLSIIDKKLEANTNSVEVPQDVKEYIATNCTTSDRKLENAINRLLAYATIMNNADITFDLAVEALKDTFGKSLITKNKIDHVMQLICDKYNLSIDDLKGKERKATIAMPRQIAMYICRTYIKESLPKIGSEFGGKDHTTVMHAVNKIKKELKGNKKLEEEIEKIVCDLNVNNS